MKFVKRKKRLIQLAATYVTFSWTLLFVSSIGVGRLEAASMSSTPLSALTTPQSHNNQLVKSARLASYSLTCPPEASIHPCTCIYHPSGTSNEAEEEEEEIYEISSAITTPYAEPIVMTTSPTSATQSSTASPTTTTMTTTTTSPSSTTTTPQPTSTVNTNLETTTTKTTTTTPTPAPTTVSLSSTTAAAPPTTDATTMQPDVISTVSSLTSSPIASPSTTYRPQGETLSTSASTAAPTVATSNPSTNSVLNVTTHSPADNTVPESGLPKLDNDALSSSPDFTNLGSTDLPNAETSSNSTQEPTVKPIIATQSTLSTVDSPERTTPPSIIDQAIFVPNSTRSPSLSEPSIEATHTVTSPAEELDPSSSNFTRPLETILVGSIEQKLNNSRVADYQLPTEASSVEQTKGDPVEKSVKDSKTEIGSLTSTTSTTLMPSSSASTTETPVTLSLFSQTTLTTQKPVLAVTSGIPEIIATSGAQSPNVSRITADQETTLRPLAAGSTIATQQTSSSEARTDNPKAHDATTPSLIPAQETASSTTRALEMTTSFDTTVRPTAEPLTTRAQQTTTPITTTTSTTTTTTTQAPSSTVTPRVRPTTTTTTAPISMQTPTNSVATASTSTTTVVTTPEVSPSDASSTMTARVSPKPVVVVALPAATAISSSTPPPQPTRASELAHQPPNATVLKPMVGSTSARRSTIKPNRANGSRTAHGARLPRSTTVKLQRLRPLSNGLRASGGNSTGSRRPRRYLSPNGHSSDPFSADPSEQKAEVVAYCRNIQNPQVLKAAIKGFRGHQVTYFVVDSCKVPPFPNDLFHGIDVRWLEMSNSTVQFHNNFLHGGHNQHN